MAALPWWDFSRIDNFGTADPQGPQNPNTPGFFWKPDSNVQLPGNYPIVAILPGTVTSVQQTAFGGQTAITVRLDSPLNGLATHTFYEHMSGATVAPGQHVNRGDLLGYNNPAGAVPLGFGFYSGDVYGHGADWQVLQNDLRPGGAQLLNPVQFLDAMRAGTATPTIGMQGAQGITPGAPTINLAGFGQKAGIFIGALVLVGFGAVLLFKQQIEGAMKKGVHVAEIGAVA